MTNPHSISELDKLASQATDYTARLIREAYEIGRQDMRRELMELLSPNDGAPTRLHYDSDASDAAAPKKTKAPPGTVRPAIVKMIEESSGVSTDEILTATGFKENSVRGTLSTLKKEGKITHNAQGYWIKRLEAPAKELAGAS
jgi:predicted HTH transcriptional regulator